MQTILIVEDEIKIAQVVAEYLAAAGYQSIIISDGALVMTALSTTVPDLILLDIMLPNVDGISLCKRIRNEARWAALPIIMLTARVEEIDRLLGLELGADDYVCKPFSPRELVARVKACLRRGTSPQTTQTQYDPLLSLNTDHFEASLRGIRLMLTPVEFRLLEALTVHPGRVLSRVQLIEAAYLDHRVVSDRTVDSHIKNLRKKLATANANEDPIESIYGLGYKWILTG